MVGPGTGMAPFRNYIWERVEENSASYETLVFFFGIRGCETDYHCKEEFTLLHAQRKVNVICAFSRDQEHKMYFCF